MEKRQSKNLSHRTAINRNKLSVPVRWLRNHNLIKGRVLDYGAGHGDIFRYWLLAPLHGDQYDPHYFPQKPSDLFDTVYCGYVLCVLGTQDARDSALADIRTFLQPDGVAYIAVRRDIKKEGLTSRGTEQYTVYLDLPLVHEEKGRYAIYEMRGI